MKPSRRVSSTGSTRSAVIPGVFLLALMTSEASSVPQVQTPACWNTISVQCIDCPRHRSVYCDSNSQGLYDSCIESTYSCGELSCDTVTVTIGPNCS
jgi:hypothetical protein